MKLPGPSARIVSLALMLASGPAIAQWQKLPPMSEPGGGFACGADRGGIIVVGGTNWKEGAKQWLQTISRFDPGTMRWDVVGKLGEPLGYAAFGTRRSDAMLVILGGSNGASPSQSVVVIDRGKPSSESAPALPRQTVLNAGGIVGDEFIIAGGTDDAANIAGFTHHAFAWNLKRKTLTQLPDYPGKPFGTAASTVLGDELFVFGGANWNETSKSVSNSTSSFAFSTSAGKWRKLKSYPVAVRGLTAVALDANRIYIAGGYGGEPEGFLTGSFIYDKGTDSYTKATPLPYAASVGLISLDGFVYCLGGEDKMKSRTDAAWRIRVVDLQPKNQPDQLLPKP